MNYARLIKAISTASGHLQERAAAAVNQSLLLRNWLVGAWLVEYEQQGRDRAKYGARLLESLAADLTAKGLAGFSSTLLKLCRQCYLTYPQIRPTVSDKLLPAGAGGALPGGEARKSLPSVIQTTSPGSIRPTVSDQLPPPLSAQVLMQLSWSKLVELLAVEDPWKRAFFENECLKGNWSVRQLRRQIGSLLYERTGLSTNKKAVIARARKQEPQETIAELIRDPYVLEFTGLAERPEYLESDLEKALLTHLQSFLLELGTGFCFEARQKRITVGRQHDYIDLVFYHRRLRCHVLIDLKIRPFKHGDAGQMNFYLNWWKTHGMEPGDMPPVGIILCSDHESAAVEFATAGIDNKLFISRYLIALPSLEKLRSFLEADRELIESLMPAVSRAAGALKRKKTRPVKGGRK